MKKYKLGEFKNTVVDTLNKYIKDKEVVETTVDKAKEDGFPKCKKCKK